MNVDVNLILKPETLSLIYLTRLPIILRFYNGIKTEIPFNE